MIEGLATVFAAKGESTWAVVKRLDLSQGPAMHGFDVSMSCIEAVFCFSTPRSQLCMLHCGSNNVRFALSQGSGEATTLKYQVLHAPALRLNIRSLWQSLPPH